MLIFTLQTQLGNMVDTNIESLVFMYSLTNVKNKIRLRLKLEEMNKCNNSFDKYLMILLVFSKKIIKNKIK